ncbi:MAG: hypothetical protein QM674_01745 [Burkholderiaceae bacterium]
MTTITELFTMNAQAKAGHRPGRIELRQQESRPRMFNRIFCALGCAVALFTGVPAFAYEAPWSNLDFLENQRWSQINNRLTNQRTADMRRMAGLDKGKSGSSGKAKTRNDRSALALGDQASLDLSPLRPYLATTQLSEKQAAKVLGMYNDVATRLNVPYNDSASGIAAFLAGTYAAYTNKPFPDQYFKPLYEQFANSMSSGSSLTKRPLAQRIEYYQRLVIVGMVFQLHQLGLQEKPDAGQVTVMREAAASAFKEIAGIAPDKIQFTANGLRPR